MLKHAVLATDLSKVSDVIINNAEKFKSFGIEKITLINVYSSFVGSQNLPEFESIGVQMLPDLEKKLNRQKNVLKDKGFEVESKLIIGQAAKEIRNSVNEFNADMLIIGSNGNVGSETVLGSTAFEVLNSIKNPVLLIVLEKEVLEKESEENEITWKLLSPEINQHILLSTDFSDFAEEAFQLIKSIKQEIPELTLLHIQDEVRLKEHLESKLEEFNNIDSKRLNRLKKAFNEAHPETKINIVIEYGKPKQKILDYINSKNNKVSLTVMGSQGRGFISRLFMGSVSHYVARHADSNVLLVPRHNPIT